MEVNNETKNPLISILIPYHNAGLYLERCLESVINQSYKNLEIILLNNASEDNSEDIAEKYSLADSRIILVSYEIPGLAGARNELLKRAGGAWAFFADSDDELDNKCIENLYAKALKEGADLVCGSYLYKTGDVLKKRRLTDSIDIIEDKEALHKFFLTRGRNFNHAWGKLYKKDLFNGLSYSEGKYYEDIEILPRLLERVQRAVISSETTYIYHKNISGISYYSDLKVHIDGLRARSSNIAFYQDKYPGLKNDAQACANEFLFFLTGKLFKEPQIKAGEKRNIYRKFSEEIKIPGGKEYGYIRLIRTLSDRMPLLMGRMFDFYSNINN